LDWKDQSLTQRIHLQFDELPGMCAVLTGLGDEEVKTARQTFSKKLDDFFPSLLARKARATMQEGKSWRKLKAQHPVQIPDLAQGGRKVRWWCGEEASAERIQNVEHADAIFARIDDLFMQSLKRSWWLTALGALVDADANWTRCIGPLPLPF
jgi:hypothetical protein